MNNVSTSLCNAFQDVASWIASVDGAMPDLVGPGEPGTGARMALCPWKIVRSLPDRTKQPPVPVAHGLFCLSLSGRDAVEAACDRIDALHFGALAEPTLDLVDPPDLPFWTGAPGFVLAFQRRIEKPASDVRPGIVELPPNLIITPEISGANP